MLELTDRRRERADPPDLRRRVPRGCGSNGPPAPKYPQRARVPASVAQRHAEPCPTVGASGGNGGTRFTPLRDVFVQRLRETPLLDAPVVLRLRPCLAT